MRSEKEGESEKEGDNESESDNSESDNVPLTCHFAFLPKVALLNGLHCVMFYYNKWYES